MMFKFLALAAFVSASNAGVLNTIQYSASPLAHYTGTPVVNTETYDAHPQYNYAYSVQDALTGDNKSHQEQRDGEVVIGQYTVVDPDGYRRVVDYTSDPVHGFKAVVRREPLAVQANFYTKPVTAPITYTSPYTKLATPVSHTTYIHH